jgi:branched-chain amino acid transport system permease protein
MYLLIMAFIWGSVVASWDLVLGYASIFSLGQLAFFAIGAYTTSILSMQAGISPWFSIFLGGLLSSAIGLLIGLPCLRLRGLYVGIVTLTLHLVMPTLIINAPESLGTGGSYGLTGIPTLQIGGYVFPDPLVTLVPWYYVAFGICFGIIFTIYKIINSSLGLAFMALRDDEPFAKSLGVNQYKHSLILFGISAFLTGIAGAFYAHFVGVVSPQVLDLTTFLFLFIMVSFGGMGRFPGAVIGAFIITFLNDALLATGVFRQVILGGIIVITMIYLPGGMMEVPELIRGFFKKRGLKRHIVQS